MFLCLGGKAFSKPFSLFIIDEKGDCAHHPGNGIADADHAQSVMERQNPQNPNDAEHADGKTRDDHRDQRFPHAADHAGKYFDGTYK